MDSFSGLLSLLQSARISPLRSIVYFVMACAGADAQGQDSSTVPARNVMSEEPKYLVFWSTPEKAGELAARVGHEGRRQDQASGLRPAQSDL